MVFILMPWLALEITGSSASSGLVITLTAIPGLLLSPVMGSIIDKLGRRRTALWVEYLAAASAVIVPLAAALWNMNLFLLVMLGLLRAFVSPGGPSARKALIPDVAAAGQMTLARANSIHEAVFASGFAIGPAIAAIAIAQIGSINTFWIVAGFGALAGVFTMVIRVVEQHEEKDTEEGESIFVYAIQGFKILFTTPSVLIMMSTFMFLAIVYLPTEMVILPTYFNSIGNPEGLGVIISTMAACSVVGALSFERINKYLSFSTIFRIAILGVAFALIPMSLLPPTPAMIVCGAILGLTWGPLGPLLNTVIQEKIPANKRGRVFSLEMTIWNGGPMISMVFVGMAVDGFGVPAVYLTLAIMVTAAAIFVATRKVLAELNQ
jgi:DHA3 family macrolide efflux protein-like MFS transporter